jgi:hypothetical protein
MKSRKIKMRITEKDILFLKYLFAMKVTTYDRAHRDIYSHYTQEGMANRLRKLESIGLIQGGIDRKVATGHKTISITKKAFNHYIKSDDENRVELKSDSPKHDLFLVDFRDALLRTRKLKKYLTENQIQTWGRHNPSPFVRACVSQNADAYIMVDIDGENIEAAIEYEAHQKNDKKYAKLVESYYSRLEIQNVFFVAENSSIIEKVKAIEKEKAGDNEPKFCYCLAKNVLSGDAISFIDLNNNAYRLST